MRVSGRYIGKSFATVPLCAEIFPRTTEDVGAVVGAAKKAAEERLATLYGLDGAQRTFANTALAMDVAKADVTAAQSALEMTRLTHKDASVREAAAAAAVDLEGFAIEAFRSNKKLHEAFMVYKDAAGTAQAQDEEAAYWTEETAKGFARRGLSLPDDKFKAVVALEKEITQLATEYSMNVAGDKTKVSVAVDGLAGVPDALVTALTKNADGTAYEVGMDYPTFFGVMKHCTVASTRQAVANAFDRRASPANSPLLHKVISLRHTFATELGFPSYAHYDLDDKMAKTPETARRFIENLVPQLQRKWDVEKSALLAECHPSVELTPSGDMQYYDVPFAMNHFKQHKLNVDELRIQEHFPMDSTFEGLFQIYEAFFDVEFVNTKRPEGFWAEDVSVLTVKRKVDGAVLGHVVMDLFPREGKFSHACCQGIVPPACVDPVAPGEFHPAVAVVLANFPKASGDKPALFTHDDAETFFHEFGHAIHFIMGRTKMPSVAGYNVKMDFVELPSQMLESWLWEPSILKQITRHYSTGQPLPDDLIEAKVRSEKAFTGRDSLRQLQLALTSLTLFDANFAAQDPSTMDSQSVVRKIQTDVMSGIAFNPDSQFLCSFEHLMGYGAAYYGYMWSEVYACDVFETIRAKNGLLCPTVGGDYVKHIIGRGGGRDPNLLLSDFLGRAPNGDAFLKRLGI